MKHLQIRLEADEHAALKRRAEAVFGYDNLQRAGREIIMQWMARTAANKTTVIGSNLTKAILRMDEARRILLDISHGLTEGSGISEPASDISGKTREVLSAEAEHPGPSEDLGTGTGPAPWRKIRPPRPTRTGPS